MPKNTYEADADVYEIEGSDTVVAPNKHSLKSLPSKKCDLYTVASDDDVNPAAWEDKERWDALPDSPATTWLTKIDELPELLLPDSAPVTPRSTRSNSTPLSPYSPVHKRGSVWDLLSSMSVQDAQATGLYFPPVDIGTDGTAVRVLFSSQKHNSLIALCSERSLDSNSDPSDAEAVSNTDEETLTLSPRGYTIEV